jgi:transcriptional regulator with XRE-family HTH domain
MRLTFKLLLDKKTLMRELKARGWSITKIANKLGVSKNLLSAMLSILPRFYEEVKEILKRSPLE